jgi:methylaspartate mutase sigma subunit
MLDSLASADRDELNPERLAEISDREPSRRSTTDPHTHTHTHESPYPFPCRTIRIYQRQKTMNNYINTDAAPRLVILGVAASDSHAVANQLIAMMLRQKGFIVINLGVCTPLEEFADAYRAYPHTEAVLIGSLNGHAYEDLKALPQLRSAGQLACPIIVGGNLSVGSHKSTDTAHRLRALGVDHILDTADELPALLDRLAGESVTATREQLDMPALATAR